MSSLTDVVAIVLNSLVADRMWDNFPIFIHFPFSSASTIFTVHQLISLISHTIARIAIQSSTCRMFLSSTTQTNEFFSHFLLSWLSLQIVIIGGVPHTMKCSIIPCRVLILFLFHFFAFRSFDATVAVECVLQIYDILTTATVQLFVV